MASTPKKIESNRANAQKSTGPRTANGKQHSKLNATYSGVYARTRVLPHESELAYHVLARRISDDLQPQGLVEEEIVQQILADIWRLRRLDAAEHAQLKQAIESQAMHRQYAGPIQTIREELIFVPPREERIDSMLKKVAKAESIAEDLATALAMSVSDLGRIQLSTMIERLRRSINRSILQNQFALEKLQERRGVMIEVVREDPGDQAIHESHPQEGFGSGPKGPNGRNPESSDSKNGNSEDEP